MRRTVSLGTLPLVLAGLLLTACDNIQDVRGFSPSPGAVDKLEVKTQSREDVQRLIGTPSAVDAGRILNTGIANAPAGIRSDNIVPGGTGTRLRYVQCPQAPFLNTNDANVCEGK
jgi:hypothetical protein